MLAERVREKVNICTEDVRCGGEGREGGGEGVSYPGMYSCGHKLLYDTEGWAPDSFQTMPGNRRVKRYDLEDSVAFKFVHLR